MSTTSRVGSLALQTSTLRDVASSQTKLAELQTQISSGYKSSDFAGLNGSVEHFTELNSQLSRAVQFQANNKVNISKLQTGDAALSHIIDIADQIKSAIVGFSGANASTSNLAQLVTDLLSSMGNELNSTVNGHYIFGGTSTDTPPVPDTTVSNTALGVPDANYYAGSQQDGIMRADDRTQMPFPVRADDPAFQKVYAAAMQAINASRSGDQTQMQSALQLIQSGQSDLVAARSKLGTAVVNVETVDSRLTTLSTYWKELADGLSKTDIVSATTQVAGYQAILQASFQVYSRLSQLRLSDYLK
ncbi:MAG: hypothetical protein V4735_02525 [Pseudomonadota bacterium]